MDYRAIIEEEAKKAGIRVYYHDHGAQWGRSDLGRKRIFIPTPKRFPSFFTGLHEIGHIMSNHHSWDGKPEYLWNTKRSAGLSTSAGRGESQYHSEQSNMSGA